MWFRTTEVNVQRLFQSGTKIYWNYRTVLWLVHTSSIWFSLFVLSKFGLSWKFEWFHCRNISGQRIWPHSSLRTCLSTSQANSIPSTQQNWSFQYNKAYLRQTRIKMGHGQSINTSSSRNASVTSESGFSSTGGRQKHGKEHKRHGVVTLKMVVSNPTRRANDQVVTHTITPKGCILYGSQAFEPTVVQQGESSTTLCIR